MQSLPKKNNRKSNPPKKQEKITLKNGESDPPKKWESNPKKTGPAHCACCLRSQPNGTGGDRHDQWGCQVSSENTEQLTNRTGGCWHYQNNQKTQTFHGVFQGWSNILPRVLQSDPQKVQGGQCWGFRTLHVQGEKNNYILKKNIYMFNKISKYVQENKYPRKICLRKILTCSKKYLLV